MSDKTAGAAERVRLKRIEVRNYCAVRLAVFEVRRGVNDIAGIPAQGKSTIPQAVAELFTKGGVASMPLRRGAGDGLIRAELTDGSVVEKKITPKGAQPTRRIDAEGNRTGIDSIAGWISEDVFKPLAFAALADTKPGRRAQAEVIAELAGLDTAEVDAQRAKHLADESAAEKAAKELEAQARGVAVPDEVEADGEEVDLASFGAKLADVEKVKAANAEQRRKVADAHKATGAAVELADRIRQEIEDLEAKLADAKGRLGRVVEEVEAKAVAAAKLADQAAQLVDPDAVGVEKQIEEARAHNSRVRAAKAQADERARKLAERAALEQKAKAKRDEERAAGGRKRDCDAQKAEMIAGAAKRMPIPGLTIEGEGADREVYLNGVPLSQASTMQRMQLGCALALAKRPKLGFLWIDYGNELDERSLEWLQAFLEDNDADAFVVHVLDEEEVASADGLIVEGGEIKADRRKTRKPRAANTITGTSEPGPTRENIEALAAGMKAGARATKELLDAAAALGVTPADDEPPAF